MKAYWRTHKYHLSLLILIQSVLIGMTIWQLNTLTDLGTPYDDAWIHFVFARNLATTGQLSFNVGTWSGGTTSLLWVLLLAAGYLHHNNIVLVAYSWGTFFYWLIGIAIYDLIYHYQPIKTAPARTRQHIALLAALIHALIGPILYFALSGMETLMFIAWGLMAINAFNKQRFKLSGLFLGLLTLTRIEGITLLLLINLVVLINRQFNKIIYISFIPGLLLLPSLAYNYFITYTLFPSTFAGRKWLFGLPLNQLIFLFEYPRVANYLRVWWVHLNQWLLNPYDIHRSYIDLLAGLACLGLSYWLYQTIWQTRQRVLGLTILIFWTVLHNLIYLILMPFPSFRYQAINFIILPLLIVIGLLSLLQIQILKPRYTELFIYGSLIIMLVVIGQSTLQWQWMHRHHVNHINNVHVQAGQWINSHLPITATVAAFDIGAVQYFGQRTMIDLGGLTEQNFTKNYLATNQVLDYLIEYRPTHLAMVENEDNLASIAYNLGLYGETSEQILERKPLQSYQTPPYIKPPFTTLRDYYFYPAYRHLVIYEIDWHEQ